MMQLVIIHVFDVTKPAVMRICEMFSYLVSAFNVLMQHVDKTIIHLHTWLKKSNQMKYFKIPFIH